MSRRQRRRVEGVLLGGMLIVTGLSAAGGCGSTEAAPPSAAEIDGGGERAPLLDGGGPPRDAGGCDPNDPFGPPRVFALPGPPGDKSRAFFSDDELRVVYDIDLDDGDGGLHGELFEATRPDANAPFSEAKRLSETHIGASERYATLSSDFRTIYFFSNPALDRRGSLHRATRVDPSSPFGAAVMLPSLTDLGELVAFYAFPVRHAPELWVSFSEPNIGSFIHRAPLGADGLPASHAIVPELESGRDHLPVIAADGLAVYWSSERDGPNGGGDVWVATRASTTAPFANLRSVAQRSTANSLGRSVNTQYYDYPVWISLDQCRLYTNTSAGQPKKEIFLSTRTK